MRFTLPFLISAVFIFSACHCSKSPSTTMDYKNCFNEENYKAVKEYVNFSISVSGMGKFYVEYPVPVKKEKEEKPGNKTLPENPANVYDVYIDATTQYVVFQNKPRKFTFDNEKGFINASSSPIESDIVVANGIFCHLLTTALKK